MESSKRKLVEFKKEILLQVDDAELILSKARSKVDDADMISPSDQQEVKDALVCRRDHAETVFERLEKDKDAEKQKLSESLEKQEKQIREAIEQMDKQVATIVGMKMEPKFVYKKLELVGELEKSYKSRYFESISEEDFNSVMDKQLLGIRSLTL